jgi:hypothetical protein
MFRAPGGTRAPCRFTVPIEDRAVRICVLSGERRGCGSGPLRLLEGGEQPLVSVAREDSVRGGQSAQVLDHWLCAPRHCDPASKDDPARIGPNARATTEGVQTALGRDHARCSTELCERVWPVLPGELVGHSAGAYGEFCVVKCKSCKYRKSLSGAEGSECGYQVSQSVPCCRWQCWSW